MFILLTIDAIRFNPKTFPQTSRIVVTIRNTFEHVIFAAFEADIKQIGHALEMKNVTSVVKINFMKLTDSRITNQVLGIGQSTC